MRFILVLLLFGLVGCGRTPQSGVRPPLGNRPNPSGPYIGEVPIPQPSPIPTPEDNTDCDKGSRDRDRD